MLKFSAFAVLLAVHVAQAQIPAGGIPLTQGDFLHSARVPSASSRARSQVVEVEHASFTQALRIEVLHEAGDPWSVEIGNPTALAVQKGDVALIHFWARGIESSDETGEVYATVYAQKAVPDWDKSLYKGFSVGLAWREFFYPFEFIDQYDAGAAAINFGVGSRRQTIEIAGFEVLHYGSSLSVSDLPQTSLTYAGRAPDAAWRQRAEVCAIKVPPLSAWVCKGILKTSGRLAPAPISANYRVRDPAKAHATAAINTEVQDKTASKRSARPRPDHGFAIGFHQRPVVDIGGFEYGLLRLGQLADPCGLASLIGAAGKVQVLGRVAVE